MKKLRIIRKLCCIENTLDKGVFDYDGTNDCVRFMFGVIVAMKINTIFEAGLYVYDYKCELGNTPDVMLFNEDFPDSPIGLYRIDD